MSPFISRLRRGINRAFAPKNILITGRKILNTVRDVATPIGVALGQPMLGAEVGLAAGAGAKGLNTARKAVNTIQRPIPKSAAEDVVYSQ